MVAFLLPILATAGAFFMGKSSSGGGIDLFRGTELFTKKEQTTITTSNQSTYSPTINRTYDIQYNIASEGSNITTKKEQVVSQTPTTTPSLTVIPTALQGAGTVGLGSSDGTSSGINIFDIVIIGGVGFGAYLLLSKPKK